MKTAFADRLWLIAIFLLLAGIHLIAGRLPCTGDESRYAFQGVGLYSNGTFDPEPTVWKRFAATSGCGSGGVLPSDQPGRPLQTISPSLVFGAALRLGGLEAARWLNYIVGCIGLALLYLMLKSQFPNRTGGTSWAGIVTVAAIAVSIPFVEYLQLIYPEILLFTIVTAALYALPVRNRSVALAAIVVLPFVHVRALPLALAFFAVMLFQMARERLPIAIWLRTCALYVAGLGIFAATQYWLYGSLTGSAFSAYSPSVTTVFERIGMQFYDVRHGAVAYAPLLLVGLAGLVLGAMRRERLCVYSLVLFATYFATFMSSTAQESWTARFWVAGLPFLAVGLCYWLYLAKRWWEWLPAVPLAALNLGNTITYALNPLWYLESRQASIPYAALFLWAHVKLGLFLPVDGDPGGIAPYTQPIGALLIYTALLIGLLVVCRVSRVARTSAIVCTLTCAVVIIPFALGLARSLPANAYTITIHPSQHEFIVRVTGGDRRVDAVQFDDQIPAYWTAPPYPKNFLIRCSAGGAVVGESVEPAHPLLMLEHCSGIDAIVITGTPLGGSDAVYRSMGGVRLIQRTL
jgi:hypothetical protein